MVGWDNTKPSGKANEPGNSGSEWQRKPNYSRVAQTEAFHRELRWLISNASLILIVVTVGVVGYMLIEGWGVFDSLYMTILTLATVGYMEVHPLSAAGRGFTIVLIVLGIGTFTVVYTAIAQSVLQRQLISAYRDKRMLDVIGKLEGHTVFCGYGRLTRVAANELRNGGVTLVIVEADPARILAAREDGFLVVEGDVTEDEVLIQAGVTRAKRLVAALPKEAETLYIVLTARELNPTLFILSRSEDESGEKRLRRAGADRVISPYRIGGLKIAEGLVRPHVTDFIDLAVSSHQGHLQIEEIQIPENSRLLGLTLQEAKLRQRAHVMVAAVISKDGQMLFNPDAGTLIEGGATFIVMGLRKDLIELENLFLAE